MSSFGFENKIWSCLIFIKLYMFDIFTIRIVVFNFYKVEFILKEQFTNAAAARSSTSTVAQESLFTVQCFHGVVSL